MKFTKAIIAALLIIATYSHPALSKQSKSSTIAPVASPNVKAYKSSFARKVSQDDLVFGMTQVDKMMKDRKPMSFLVKKGDPIYTWVVRQFAGEACGERISWNAEEDLGKPSEYRADHCYPSKDERAYIRIRSNNGAGNFYDEHSLWESCIFELHNIRNFKAFEKVFHDACKGKMTKDEWLRRNTLIEYKSNIAVKDFFYRHWAPYLQAKGIDSGEHLWNVDWTPNTFDKWIKAYNDPNGYPWDYWGTYYDNQIVPYLKALKANPYAHLR